MTAEMIKTSPRWQGLELTGKRLDNGEMELGKPLIVNCYGHGTTTERVLQGPWCDQCSHSSCESIRPIYICADCATDFAGVLADIPHLLDDLDIAIAGEASFVEHGTTLGSVEDLGPSRHPAIAAHQRLCLALHGDGTAAHPGCIDWFDARDHAQLARHLRLYLSRLLTEERLPQLARDISSAAARAHRVIDTPMDLVFYGPCPDCGRDITQERIHRDDQEAKVRCRFPSCGYAETLDLHQKRILEANLDRQMTVSECVSAITSAGEVVTRDQINGWIRHKGLPREWTERPEWQNGVPVMVGLWTLKLRDVLDYARRAEQKKQAKSAS